MLMEAFLFSKSTAQLVWYYKKLADDMVRGHNGGEEGVATEMFFRPEDWAGVILLMNVNWSQLNYALILEIEERLFKESERY